MKSAGTWIHGRGKHKSRWKGERHGGASDAYGAVFERLAHDFKNVARKFRKFVEEQNAVVRERNLPRPRDRPTANQACVRNGVMRRTERTQADQSSPRVEHAGHAVNLGGLERFFESKGRQDGRHAFR